VNHGGCDSITNWFAFKERLRKTAEKCSEEGVIFAFGRSKICLPLMLTCVVSGEGVKWNQFYLGADFMS